MRKRIKMDKTDKLPDICHYSRQCYLDVFCFVLSLVFPRTRLFVWRRRSIPRGWWSLGVHYRYGNHSHEQLEKWKVSLVNSFDNAAVLQSLFTDRSASLISTSALLGHTISITWGCALCAIGIFCG
jgi:hypothetical protein